jgi:hypothetical protein
MIETIDPAPAAIFLQAPVEAVQTGQRSNARDNVKYQLHPEREMCEDFTGWGFRHISFPFVVDPLVCYK